MDSWGFDPYQPAQPDFWWAEDQYEHREGLRQEHESKKRLAVYEALIYVSERSDVDEYIYQLESTLFDHHVNWNLKRVTGHEDYDPDDTGKPIIIFEDYDMLEYETLVEINLLFPGRVFLFYATDFSKDYPWIELGVPGLFVQNNARLEYKKITEEDGHRSIWYSHRPEFISRIAEFLKRFE